jgi:hypothetical protein
MIELLLDHLVLVDVWRSELMLYIHPQQVRASQRVPHTTWHCRPFSPEVRDVSSTSHTISGCRVAE